MKHVNQKEYPDFPYITRQFCDKEEDREKRKNHHNLQLRLRTLQCDNGC